MSVGMKYRSKGGQIEYVSNAHDVIMTMGELERAALKEVAKLLRKAVKSRAPVRSGHLRKNVGTWVKRKGPEGPHLQVGVYNRERAHRKGLSYAFYAHFIEFGTRFRSARPFLKPAVMDNIDNIRIIQGKFLKHIENENLAKGLINPAEEIKDD